MQTAVTGEQLVVPTEDELCPGRQRQDCAAANLDVLSGKKGAAQGGITLDEAGRVWTGAVGYRVRCVARCFGRYQPKNEDN